MTDTLTDAALVFLGWLLGTLSPAITRGLERRRRRTELLRGLVHECTELRFTMANLLFTSRRSARVLDHATLNVVKPILTTYDGPYDRDLVDGLRRLFATDDAAVIALANATQNQKRDQYGRPIVHWPAPYSAPFLTAHMGELDLLPADAEERLHRIDAELKLFNNQVEYLRHLLDRSFMLSGPNHELNATAIEGAQSNFAIRCEVLLKALGGFLDLASVTNVMPSQPRGRPALAARNVQPQEQALESAATRA